MAKTVHVLVVDDEEVALASIAKALKSSEERTYQLEDARSADEALVKLALRHYDLVLTDLMMPGLDGIELLDRIRAVDPNLKVIMITGYATMGVARDALHKGACDFIAKPFTHQELRETVAQALTATA